MSRQIRSMTPSVENCANFDVLIVGAGFAGMYMLHKCRQLSLSRECLKSVKVLEVHGIGTDTRALVVMWKVCNTRINLTLN